MQKAFTEKFQIATDPGSIPGGPIYYFNNKIGKYMEDIIKFYLEINKLKEMKRSGWVVDGVEEPEHIADHCFGVALMTLVLGSKRKDIDLQKAVKMAIVHELAESQTGDILVDWKMAADKKANRARIKGNHDITEEEKHKLENDAMEKLATLLGDFGKEALALWLEFEEQKTKESVFVKSVDKIEMFLQVLTYEKKGYNFDDWFAAEKNHPKDPEVVKLFQHIQKSRK